MPRKILIEEENDVDQLDDALPAEPLLSTGTQDPGTRLEDGGINHRANASRTHQGCVKAHLHRRMVSIIKRHLRKIIV